MVGSGTCLHPAGVGGSQFTMTLWMGYAQTPEIENGRHRVMVNGDPPISQVIHLPGAIQKGNTSIQYASTGTVSSIYMARFSKTFH